MTSTQTNPSGKVDPGVRELILTAADDVSTMVSAQVELAKAELRQSAQQAGTAFGMIIAAVAIFGIGAIFLLVTLAYVLVALGLPVWAGFGIVTLLLFIVGAILGVLGRKHAEKVKSPERTAEQLELTKAAFAETARSTIAGS
jgi:hypothetical protein